VPVVLVGNTLYPHVSDKVTELLPVARGRADHHCAHRQCAAEDTGAEGSAGLRCVRPLGREDRHRRL